MRKDSGKITFDKVLFWSLLAGYTAVMLYLFVMQCYEVPVFRSDMPDYVNKVRGIKGNYEFPYPFFFTFAKVIALFAGAPLGVAIATAALNSFGLVLTRYYMGKVAKDFIDTQGWNEKQHSLFNCALTILSFVLFLLGNLYSPKNTAFFGFDYAYRCMGIYTPNPIWNATYLATRPFSIICFFEAANILKKYQDAFSFRACVPFAASLFLMTITKPSHTLVIVPLMGILLVADLVRTRGKSLQNAFFLCVTMIPTGIDMLYQFFGVFTGVNAKGEDTGIGFAFAKVWSNFSKNIPLSIVMGMAFTFGILVLNYKSFAKHFVYRFAWYQYLVATVMFLCLYEKGFRWEHANFSWGYMHAMFFCFFLSLILILKNTVEWRKSKKAIFLPAEWAVLFYHLACGVNFLRYALCGNDLAGF